MDSIRPDEVSLSKVVLHNAQLLRKGNKVSGCGLNLPTDIIGCWCHVLRREKERACYTFVSQHQGQRPWFCEPGNQMLPER